MSQRNFVNANSTSFWTASCQNQQNHSKPPHYAISTNAVSTNVIFTLSKSNFVTASSRSLHTFINHFQWENHCVHIQFEASQLIMYVSNREKLGQMFIYWCLFLGKTNYALKKMFLDMKKISNQPGLVLYYMWMLPLKVMPYLLRLAAPLMDSSIVHCTGILFCPTTTVWPIKPRFSTISIM